MKNTKEFEEEIEAKAILRDVNKRMKLKDASKLPRWKIIITLLVFYILGFAPLFYYQFAAVEKEDMSTSTIISVVLSPLCTLFILISAVTGMIIKRLEAINELIEIIEKDDNKSLHRTAEPLCDLENKEKK